MQCNPNLKFDGSAGHCPAQVQQLEINKVLPSSVIMICEGHSALVRKGNHFIFCSSDSYIC